MSDIVRIYNTTSETDAILAKALLEGADIGVMMREKNPITFTPEYGRPTFPEFALYVLADRVDEARVLIAVHQAGIDAPEEQP